MRSSSLFWNQNSFSTQSTASYVKSMTTCLKSLLLTWNETLRSLVSLRASVLFQTFTKVRSIFFKPRSPLTSRVSTLVPCHANSQLSSLGPSDSASQLSKHGSSLAETIENLLQCVQPPSMRPEYLPPSVLWFPDDCKTDKTHGAYLRKPISADRRWASLSAVQTAP